MDAQTQLKVDIISKVAGGKISISNASKLLNKSRRTIERYLSQYKKEGIQFAIHKNKSKAPNNKMSQTLKDDVQKLIKNKYYDFNLTHLQEKLLSNEGIDVKRETLRNWAHEIHHVKRAKKRRAKARKKRDRMTSPGLLLQLDGSSHLWFGDKKTCLLAIIDDANSKLYAEFFESESTSACMKLLKDFISENGLSKALYVDRAGIYGGPKRCHFSQVQRACEEVGIEIIYAHSAEAKGRIERSFDTLQDRLIPELRINGIESMKLANKYLKEIFIPKYWDKNIMVVPENIESQYTNVPLNQNIDEIFIQKEFRKIRNDHTFSFDNSLYLIESDLRRSIAKQEIEIRVYPDNTFSAFFSNRKLSISKVKKPTKQCLYELEIQEKIDAIELAKQIGNVSEAARLSGVSRQTIYKNKKLLEEKGPMALKRTFNSDHRHKNRASEELEKLVVDFGIRNPHLGQAQVSAHINQKTNYEISSAGVRLIWQRHNMHTMKLRLEAGEKLATKKAA